MEIDLKNIKRRERRFYRTFDDGEIKYTDKPETVKEEKTTEKKIDLNEEDTNAKLDITDTEKKRIIDKILTEMKTNINPDIDEISDVIYSQLSNNLKISQETVKHVVEENVHYRRSRQTKPTDTLDYLNDRKEMELVLDNIVEENIKEQTREKNNPKVEKIAIEEKPKARRHKEEEKVQPKKKEDKPAKKKEETKTKKEDLELDFGDDDDIDIDSQDDEDDLGLKF